MKEDFIPDFIKNGPDIEDIEQRAAQSYAMLEARKDAEINRLNSAMLSIAIMLENDGDEFHAGAMLRSEMTPNVKLTSGAAAESETKK